MFPTQLAIGADSAPKAKKRQRSGGSGLGLLLTLLVLGGLVAAAFVYGRPYLFPDDWEGDAQAHATSIETVRGEEIAEPFSILPETADVFAAGFDAERLSGWESDAALWRAFGMLEPGLDASSIGSLVGQRPAAYFSVTDRQVHIDETAAPATIDAATAVASAESALDQAYRWTLALDGVPIERQALVRAVVASEAQRIQQAGDFAGPLPAVDASSPELPPMLEHRLLAPEVYTAVIGVPTGGAESRISSLDSFAGDLPGATTLPLAQAAVLQEGETTAGPALAMDRSFWFLAFASHLDAPTAYDLSSTLSAASLTPVRTETSTSCWAAVFDMPSPEQAFGLATSLAAWSEVAPAAATPTITGVAERTIQLRVCDPDTVAAPDAGVTDAGAIASSSAARALVAYRAAELATVVAVSERGGGQPEIVAALDLLGGTTIGDELAAQSDLSPADLGARAVERVTSIVDTATAGLPAAPAPAVGEPVASDTAGG